MRTVIIDTGVLAAGVFWRHEPHLCLKAWLHGIVLPVVTEEIFAEYETVLERLKERERFETDIEPWLNTLRRSALWVTPVTLTEKVCRDTKDDKFIGAALAAGAQTIISRDRDLTVLEKPFGISMLTPRAWLGTLSRAERRQLEKGAP